MIHEKNKIKELIANCSYGRPSIFGYWSMMEEYNGRVHIMVNHTRIYNGAKYPIYDESGNIMKRTDEFSYECDDEYNMIIRNITLKFRKYSKLTDL